MSVKQIQKAPITLRVVGKVKKYSAGTKAKDIDSGKAKPYSVSQKETKI